MAEITARAEAFVERWGPSGDQERADYASFLKEFCGLLGLEEPQPTNPGGVGVAIPLDEVGARLSEVQRSLATRDSHAGRYYPLGDESIDPIRTEEQ